MAEKQEDELADDGMALRQEEVAVEVPGSPSAKKRKTEIPAAGDDRGGGGEGAAQQDGVLVGGETQNPEDGPNGEAASPTVDGGGKAKRPSLFARMPMPSGVMKGGAGRLGGAVGARLGGAAKFGKRLNPMAKLMRKDAGADAYVPPEERSRTWELNFQIRNFENVTNKAI
eukprot:g10219.t1